jgi:hypothetical protein
MKLPTVKKATMRLTAMFFTWLAMGLLCSMLVFATTYYVDPTGGNDSNNGTSTGTAWRTLGKVNGFAFAPGDVVLFKKGGTWSGQLLISRAGTASAVITFPSFGTGNKPLINANGAVRDAIFIQNTASHIIVDGFAVTNFDGSNIFDGAEAKRTSIRCGSIYRCRE